MLNKSLDLKMANSNKDIKKKLRDYESRLKNQQLTDSQADDMLNDLDNMMSELETKITNDLRKIKNKYEK
jgi:hypothetical protein